MQKPKLGTVEFFVPSFDKGLTFVSQIIFIRKDEDSATMYLQWPSQGVMVAYTTKEEEREAAIYSASIYVGLNESGSFAVPGSASLAFEAKFVDSKHELAWCDTRINLLSLK